MNKLRVSLTKHGAHKVAYLVSHFDKDDVLNHLSGDYKNINIDYAQTSKILSLDNNGIVPELWNQIKKYGEEDIFDLVFISNVFSHVNLINTIINGIENNCIIKRGEVIGGKAYTNFAHTIEQFNYSIEHTPDYISFDISRIFYKFYLTKFIYEILRIKLIDAGWDHTNSLLDECISLNFHKVFGLSKNDFKTWLQGNIEVEEIKIRGAKAKRNFNTGIKFKSGHNTKFEGEVTINTLKQHTATFLHNLIQNKVYQILKKQYPTNEIGTETPSNIGSIDIVRRSNYKYIFYEIKTANTTKSNIRQALSQLLEYAYWNNINGIEELIVVAPTPPTSESKKYLELLRNKFNIPIFYQYYNMKTNTLHKSE